MERNLTLDTLKIVLAFMVVGIHGGFLKEYSELGNYLFLNGLFLIAVPIFFIINGYFFYIAMTKNEHKWIIKLLKIYLFWMLFYSYFWVGIYDFDLIGILKILKTIVMGYQHLWYIAATILSAIVVLFLRKTSDRILVYLVSLLFLVGIITQYIENYQVFNSLIVNSIFEKSHMFRNFIFVGFPFFLFGVLANKYNLKEVVTLRMMGVYVILSLSLLFVESYLNYYLLGNSKEFGLLISLVFVSPAIFIWSIKMPMTTQKKNLTLISANIYFIHLFFIFLLKKYFVFGGTVVTLIAIFLSFIASLIFIRIKEIADRL